MNAFERAYVGLGANVGTAQASLERAVVALGALPGTTVGAVSGLYRTRPVGPPAQPDFLNAVAALQVPAAPDPAAAALSLLGGLKDIERALGRQERQRWGPREVDLDLLLFGDHALHIPHDAAGLSAERSSSGSLWLDVPHPAARERLFVLAPLAELASDLVPPGWDMTVAEASRRAWRREGPSAARRVGAWDAARGRWGGLAPSGGSGAAL